MCDVETDFEIQTIQTEEIQTNEIQTEEIPTNELQTETETQIQTEPEQMMFVDVHEKEHTVFESEELQNQNKKAQQIQRQTSRMHDGEIFKCLKCNHEETTKQNARNHEYTHTHYLLNVRNVKQFLVNNKN